MSQFNRGGNTLLCTLGVFFASCVLVGFALGWWWA